MTRRIWLALAAAAAAWAQELPSADTLLERYVEATGGAKAYASRKSEVMHGSVVMAAMGLKGTVTEWSVAEPLKFRRKMELPGVGLMETGVATGVAWDRSDLMGPRVKSGAELAEAVREVRLNAAADWRQLYEKVETTGEETVNGAPCYLVRMTPKEGHAETLYLSKETGLPVKMATVVTSQMGEVPAEVLYAEYRDFGGILRPSRVIEKAAGQQIEMTVERVEVNGEIPEELFVLPPDVAALVARQAAPKQ